jgi:hypothetical protein
MHTARPRRSSVAVAPRSRRSRKSRRPRACPREAWITDPQALLRALARAESTAADAEQPRLTAQPCLAEVHAPPTACVPARAALPVPREGERVVRTSSEGIVVIIRRRSAA